VITPRRTRLVRVPDLHAFRDAIARLASNPEPRTSNPEPRTSNPEPRTRNPEPRTNPAPCTLSHEPIIVVPTRAAAHQLARRTAAANCVTRDGLYDRLHARLVDPPRRLTALERDVIAQASARAASNGIELTFRIRPGLVAAMMRFYDQLRRHSRQVDRFEALIDEALGDIEGDRAADRMRRQTRFLADAFREYERRVRATGACDEHLLRDALLAGAALDPVRRIVVTMPDWIGDPDGLHVADFDLLARIPGLETLDIVATEGVLASGFDERLQQWLPEIEEVRLRASRFGETDFADTGLPRRSPPEAGEVGLPGIEDGQERQEGQDGPGGDGGSGGRHEHSPQPVLVTPPGGTTDEPWWTLRDREEELIAIARRVCAAAGTPDAAPLDRIGVVFKRPLPYLYLAPKVFGEAGLAYQTSAALPLAAEPTAAALDLVLDAAESTFTRATLVALLRSPHFQFGDVSREAVSALDRRLSEARYLGESAKLAALAAEWSDRASEPALRAAETIARELEPLANARPASQQLSLLRAFWSARLRPVPDLAPRDARARAAMDQLLAALESAHAAQDDPQWTIDDLAVAVRRAIEDSTFAAESAGHGIHLLDEQAARYGDFDEVTIVGVIEADWPESPHRNIFYPPALMKALGWPPEQERRAAADARFVELLASAARRTAVSTFTLDDDALVTRSIQLDEIARARLSTVSFDAALSARLFLDERLPLDPPLVDALDEVERAWIDMRLRRTPADAAEFHGAIGAFRSTQPWAVSALETYIDCPFKFFARRVLRLEEEPDDEEVMDPRRQGQFVHEVFEAFFREWQDAGHREITADNLDAARELFVAVVDRLVATLPDGEAGLERARLLGSPAAAGLGEAVFRMEAERPVRVIQRLLEHEFRGEFTFAAADGARRIALRGKMDRLDLLEDGTFRLIDYKLGRAPNAARALQLPVYSVCAEQELPPHRGQPWRLGEAAYLAFKGPRRVVPLYRAPSDRPRVLGEAQQRLVDTVDAIGRGEFPPHPEDVYRCEMCSFPAVCRKDYVGDV
jgi:RecB family exonuclease